jgi:hypothetical protein
LATREADKAGNSKSKSTNPKTSVSGLKARTKKRIMWKRSLRRKTQRKALLIRRSRSRFRRLGARRRVGGHRQFRMRRDRARFGRRR